MDRTGGMGSTDVIEIAGLSPYKGAGPWRVYNSKLLAPDADVEPPIEEEDTDCQAWGKRQEAVIVQWYAHHVGDEYWAAARVESIREPWLWATPDAQSVRDKTDYLEAKNVGSFMSFRWSSDEDGIPHDVRAQVTLGMFCAEVDHWTVAASIGGLPPRVYRVPYDADLAGMLVERGRRFWTDHVLAKVPPSIDGSEECKRYLDARYPKDNAEVLIADFDQEMIAATRIGAFAGAKEGERIKKECDAKLLAGMRENSVLIGNGWKMTWKNGAGGVRRARFTGKGVEE